jgi:hypothetical protein
MKSHIARVHESRKNLCEHCNRGFVEKHELKKHILQYHSDHPGYYCDSCGRLLPTLAALRYEIYSIVLFDFLFSKKIFFNYFPTEVTRKISMKNEDSHVTIPAVIRNTRFSPI